MTCHQVEDDPELLILLPLSSKFWDYRPAPPRPASFRSSFLVPYLSPCNGIAVPHFFVSSSLWIIVLSGTYYKNFYLIHQKPGGLFLTEVPDEGSDLISMLVISLCQTRREMDKRRQGKAARTNLASIPTQPCCQEAAQDGDSTVILAGTESPNKDKNYEPTPPTGHIPKLLPPPSQRDSWADKVWSPRVSQTTNCQPLRAKSLPKTGEARKLQLCTPLARTLPPSLFSFDPNDQKRSSQ